MTHILKFVNYLYKKNLCSQEEINIVAYGIYVGLELIINIITTIIIGICLNCLYETMLFLISYSLIRSYAGGYHCKKAINCYFCSSLIIIISVLIIKGTPAELLLPITLGLLIFSIPIILKIGPDDSKVRKLDKQEKLYFRKKLIIYLCIEIFVILVLLLVGMYYHSYIISIGIFMSAILLIIGRQ